MRYARADTAVRPYAEVLLINHAMFDTAADTLADSRYGSLLKS